MVQAKSAVKLTGNTLLATGVFQTCVGFMAMMPSYIGTSIPIETLAVSIPIALLGTFYGLIGFLLLLPIRMKLEAMCFAGEL